MGGPQSAFRAYSDLVENNGWSEFPTDGAAETDLEDALGVGSMVGFLVPSGLGA